MVFSNICFVLMCVCVCVCPCVRACVRACVCVAMQVSDACLLLTGLHGEDGVVRRILLQQDLPDGRQ